MRHVSVVVCGLGSLLWVVGCRAPTRVVIRVTEVPRVDLELSGGNRGYLIGTPPEPKRLKTTRQMIETDVEIPSFYKPKPPGLKVRLDDLAAPETDAAREAAGMDVAAGAASYDTYVVQKGDSLWSIAAKPEIYGKATRWRQLLEANRELLKGSPDRLRAGMTIKIPRGDSGEGATTSDEEGVTWKK